MGSYLNDPEADAKSYFYLTGATNINAPLKSCRYFLTGDIGVIDSGSGCLSLKGRAKELIKKGGEQVSPHEVEEVLIDHPWIHTCMCMSVPSDIYGEEVGCALVLSDEAPEGADDKVIIKQMRQWLKEEQLAAFKWPSRWVIVDESTLPRTGTNKLIRRGSSMLLGLEKCESAGDDMNLDASKETRAKIDWDCIIGFRFVLACYVMFMHIGSNESWGRSKSSFCVTSLRLPLSALNLVDMFSSFLLARSEPSSRVSVACTCILHTWRI